MGGREGNFGPRKNLQGQGGEFRGYLLLVPLSWWGGAGLLPLTTSLVSDFDNFVTEIKLVQHHN